MWSSICAKFDEGLVILQTQRRNFSAIGVGKDTKSETGLALTYDEVGSRAIDWLDSLLRSGERGTPIHPATMSIDMVWQDGKTAPGMKPLRKRPLRR